LLQRGREQKAGNDLHQRVVIGQSERKNEDGQNEAVRLPGFDHPEIKEEEREVDEERIERAVHGGDDGLAPHDIAEADDEPDEEAHIEDVGTHRRLMLRSGPALQKPAAGMAGEQREHGVRDAAENRAEEVDAPGQAAEGQEVRKEEAGHGPERIAGRMADAELRGGGDQFAGILEGDVGRERGDINGERGEKNDGRGDEIGALKTFRMRGGETAERLVGTNGRGDGGEAHVREFRLAA
jgi:hypothetical protein